MQEPLQDAPETEILHGEILEGAEEKSAENENRVRKGFWKTAARAAGRIPFLDEVIASYYCALDPATPSRVRAILLAALAYFVLPLDSIPDFIVGFGFTDDIAVLGAVLAAIRGNIRDEHRQLAASKIEALRQAGEAETGTRDAPPRREAG